MTDPTRDGENVVELRSRTAVTASFTQLVEQGNETARSRVGELTPARPLPSQLSIGLTQPPSNPSAVARDILAALGPLGISVVRWRDNWLIYSPETRGRYRRIGEEDDRTVMSDIVRNSLERASYVKHGNDDEIEYVSWNPNIRSVHEVVASIETFTRLPGNVGSHSWLDPWVESQLPSHELIVCRNGILQVSRRDGRKLWQHDTRFFTEVALDLDYDQHAPPPAYWLKFLNDLWPNDPLSVMTLQEWFGYVLSGSTRLHKILLLIGPRRGGKGTIRTVLVWLLGGQSEIVTPTLKTLRGAFGLESFLGKRLAVVSDARGSGDPRELVEILLNISGEDPVNVNRKNRPELSGILLPVRIMLMSNEELNLRDASGAMPSRFVPLKLTESWLGREDLTLKDKLLSELPGILNWSLDGLDRLQLNDFRFTMSAASSALMDDLEEDASPVKQFTTMCCDVDLGNPEYWVYIQSLYEAWSIWARLNGYEAGSAASFGRHLRAVNSKITTARPGTRGNQKYVYRGIRLTNPPYPMSAVSAAPDERRSPGY